MNSIEDLRRADPAAGIVDGPLDARALTDLHRAMSPQRPPRIGVRRRAALIAAGVATFAVAATVGVPLVGGERAEAAYTVQGNDDGTVLIRIVRYEDADGLEAAIESYGVNAEVDYLPYGQICREPRFTVEPTADLRAAVGAGDGDGLAIRFRPADYDADETLIIVHTPLTSDPASYPSAGLTLPSGEIRPRTHLALAEGPVAACEPVDLPR